MKKKFIALLASMITMFVQGITWMLAPLTTEGKHVNNMSSSNAYRSHIGAPPEVTPPKTMNFVAQLFATGVQSFRCKTEAVARGITAIANLLNPMSSSRNMNLAG